MFNKIIESHVAYGREDFQSLIGFQLVKVEERELGDSEGTGMEFTFKNTHHVAIGLSYIDGELFISEPYAVKDDLSIACDYDMKP